MNLNRTHARSMSIQLSMPTAKPVLFKVRGYGDSVMIDLMGLDTNLFGVGNFQNVCLFDPNNDAFGAVSNYQTMDAEALHYLEQIQSADAATVKMKLNWLGMGSFAGRPYMLKNGFETWGLMVFGFNWVQVEAVNGEPVEYVKRARYQSRNLIEDIPMYKVIGMRRSDMARPVAELIAEGLIHHATEAFYPTNKLGETPQGGVILNPVWSPLDWPTNTGSRELYIPKAFLFL